nr:MAG TPA: hypothetical protein [Caudoviricetes sp.]
MKYIRKSDWGPVLEIGIYSKCKSIFVIFSFPPNTSKSHSNHFINLSKISIIILIEIILIYHTVKIKYLMIKYLIIF